MTDFIIVGRGLAASTLMHVLHSNKLSFTVIGKEELSRCSQVAAGIWNPVVFKRLTKSWMADELIPALRDFYSLCEKRLGVKFVQERKIIRPFSEEQEKTLWLKKSKNELDEYLDPRVYEANETAPHTKSPKGFGLVKGAGSIDTRVFLSATAQLFNAHTLNEVFDHGQLAITTEGIAYKDLRARNLIFCEGYLVRNNPLFKWIPLKPAKGEVLTVSVGECDLGTDIFSRSAFVMQTQKGEYRVGATYEWNVLDDNPTQEAREHLEEKLREITDSPFQLLRHEAGVRPSAVDRRPIVGPHPGHKQVFIFNGLGTKGVMLAPYFANNFVNFYLNKEPLHAAVHVSRFYHLHEGA